MYCYIFKSEKGYLYFPNPTANESSYSSFPFLSHCHSSSREDMDNGVRSGFSMKKWDFESIIHLDLESGPKLNSCTRWDQVQMETSLSLWNWVSILSYHLLDLLRSCPVLPNQQTTLFEIKSWGLNMIHEIYILCFI